MALYFDTDWYWSTVPVFVYSQARSWHLPLEDFFFNYQIYDTEIIYALVWKEEVHDTVTEII